MSSPTGCPIVAGGNALGIAVENMLCPEGALQIGGRALTAICAFLSHGKVEASDSEMLFEIFERSFGVPFEGVEFCVRRPHRGRCPRLRWASPAGWVHSTNNAQHPTARLRTLDFALWTLPRS